MNGSFAADWDPHKQLWILVCHFGCDTSGQNRDFRIGLNDEEMLALKKAIKAAIKARDPKGRRLDD